MSTISRVPLFQESPLRKHDGYQIKQRTITSLNQFIINWRPGVDKIIIVITDEKEQSYLHPSITNQHLIDALTATPQSKLHTFTRYSFWQWDEISASTGGENFKLSSNPTEIYNSLMQILDEVCKSESQ